MFDEEIILEEFPVKDRHSRRLPREEKTIDVRKHGVNCINHTKRVKHHRGCCDPNCHYCRNNWMRSEAMYSKSCGKNKKRILNEISECIPEAVKVSLHLPSREKMYIIK